MLSRSTLATLAVIAVGLLAGCTTPPYRTALPPAAAPQLQNTSGVVALQQHEIDTSINPSNLTGAAGGGLLWAIVDAAANAHSAKKNENFAAGLRQALLEYQFEDDAIGALTGRFDEGDGMRLATVVVAPDTTIANLNQLIANAEGDAVAILFVHHLMNPEFTRVIVTANVLVCAKADALRTLAQEHKIGATKVPVLYRNFFQSAWKIPADLQPPETKREHMVVAWSTDHGRPVRESLRRACDEIAAMLAWDLSLPAQEKYTERGAARMAVAAYRGPAAMYVPGHTVTTENGRAWIRTPDGELYGEP